MITQPSSSFVREQDDIGRPLPHQQRLAHHHRRPANPATATQLAAVGASVGQFGLVALAATPARWAVLTATAAVVGAVLRSAAGAITTAVAVLFAPPILGALVSNELVVTGLDHLPAGLSTMLVGGTGECYSPEVAALLLGAWAVGALAVGVVTRHRRDP